MKAIAAAIVTARIVSIKIVSFRRFFMGARYKNVGDATQTVKPRATAANFPFY